MDSPKTFNTIYAECFDEIWDYYFNLKNLQYSPKILIGVERQREISRKNGIVFYNREIIYNQELKFKHDLTDFENQIIQTLSNDKILSKMYMRNSFDSKISDELLYELNRNYAVMWFYFIREYKLEVLVLHEMPHLPYTYIGYLIFQALKLQIIFSATLQFKNRAYFTDSLKNYSLFKEEADNYLSPIKNQAENLFYYEKLLEQYSIKKEKQIIKKRNSFLNIFFIYFKKLLFPGKTDRLNFNIIWKGKFTAQPDRIYYLLIIKNLIKKFFRKIYYRKIAIDSISDGKLNFFYAMHYEPELAVYPLAGENFCQFNNLISLSKKLGVKGTIYVKEHPWVFDYSKVKGIIRDKEFYEKLSKQKNIKFLDYQINVENVLPKMDAVVTLTGTIGWEVFFKKIPVLYFGYPWYAGLPGMRKFTEDIDLEKFLFECKNEYDKINYKTVYDKMSYSLWKVSTKMNSNDGLDLSEKAILLKTAVEEFITLE